MPFYAELYARNSGLYRSAVLYVNDFGYESLLVRRRQYFRFSLVSKPLPGGVYQEDPISTLEGEGPRFEPHAWRRAHFFIKFCGKHRKSTPKQEARSVDEQKSTGVVYKSRQRWQSTSVEKAQPDAWQRKRKRNLGQETVSRRCNQATSVITNPAIPGIVRSDHSNTPSRQNMQKLAASATVLSVGKFYLWRKQWFSNHNLVLVVYKVLESLNFILDFILSPNFFLYDLQVMPQYMNDLGYESHMVGKWHLGSYNDASTPTHRGFKTHLGYLSGQETYYKHKVI